MTWLRLLILTLALCGAGVAFAANGAADASVAQLLNQADKVPAADTPNPEATAAIREIQAAADRLTHEFNMHKESNKVYEIGILSVLAVVTLFLVLNFLTKHTVDAGPNAVNATALVCIIFGTILLVLMAQSDQQLTAAMGILGAIAGYLFRSMRNDGPSESASRALSAVTPVAAPKPTS